MKNAIKLLLPALIATLLSACVPALQPFYTKSQLRSDPALIGKWRAHNAADTWEFRENGDKAYTLIYTDKNGHSGKLDAHLFELGDMRFIDIAPDGDSLKHAETPDFYNAHLLAAHSLIRVESLGPTLMLSFLNPKFLEQELKAKPDITPHAEQKNRIILTGSTEQLQKLILDHAEAEEFFTKPMDLLPE